MNDAPADSAAPQALSPAAVEPAAAPAAHLDPFAVPPVSLDDPCGPDLDLEGDAKFLNFVAATEGLLPGKEAKYFYEFKRDSIDFPASFQEAEKLLGRTLDVRLLVLVAKLSILNRDLTGFAGRIRTLAWALRERWDGVHPRSEGDDYSARLAQLMTLEENTTVLLPLQYATLLETPREGAFSYRDQLVATGAVAPRLVSNYDLKGEKETSAPEKFMPPKTIERLLRDVEINQLAGLFETLGGLSAALQSIRAATVEHVGFERAIEFPKLAKLVREMTEFARAALIARDPALAPAPEAAARADDDGVPEALAAGAPSAFASRVEVDAALASAIGYFAVSEPTSPALLLIGQAREVLGKNLYEVMKLLAPPHADNARVFVGPDGAFTVPVKSLASAPSVEFARAPSEPAASRAAALALIEAVALHMQRAEPSSPLPYLLDRARNLASRDFVSLLHDVLPEDAIADLKQGK
jgi:type VI secretion system protein ImpA